MIISPNRGDIKKIYSWNHHPVNLQGCNQIHEKAPRGWLSAKKSLKVMLPACEFSMLRMLVLVPGRCSWDGLGRFIWYVVWAKLDHFIKWHIIPSSCKKNNHLSIWIWKYERTAYANPQNLDMKNHWTSYFSHRLHHHTNISQSMRSAVSPLTFDNISHSPKTWRQRRDDLSKSSRETHYSYRISQNSHIKYW